MPGKTSAVRWLLWAMAWRRAFICTSTANCWTRPVARRYAVSGVIRSSVLSVKAASMPASLTYNQPKQLANVAVLPLFPGISAEVLSGLLDSGIQGLVLECYGSGTGPSDNPEFLAALERARDNGVVVVAVTQCHEGGVELDVYEAGSRLRGVGVLSGGGMTREAAFGKLHALLGAGLDNAEVRRLIELDLCGELS